MNTPTPVKPIKIAHLSDVHFGRIAYPEIVARLVEEINADAVDLVVVSGDLTQRARRRQFKAAAEMLASFTAPVLVVPGNHDVYPWWRPLSRIFWPLSRYRRVIAGELTPEFEMEGLAVLGINSAHGRTVKGGRIGRPEREAIRSFFSERPADVFKVLVVHHHLVQIQALGPHDVARKARRALQTASGAGVDLVLCGHLHVSHIEPLEIAPEQHRMVIASAGTATSNRGRKSNRSTNFYNIITILPDYFVIEERRYMLDAGRFAPENTTHFDRLRVSEKSAPEPG